MGMEKNYKVDLEKGLKIISVLGSTTGDALRPFVVVWTEMIIVLSSH